MNSAQPVRITAGQARRALLCHQALWPPRSLRGWNDVAAYFGKVGSMQFDPVDVAGISPEISLCARVRGFQRGHLSQWLYGERVLCDMWDKNACISAVEDRPYLLANRIAVDVNWGWRVHNSQLDVEEATPVVIERLRSEGPLSTTAFRESDVQREALERLLLRGQVGVHHREGRRRFFDLTERLLPESVRQPARWSEQERDDWFVRRRIGAIGLLWNRRTDAFLGINMDTAHREAAFERLEAAGSIAKIEVEGISERLYCRTDGQGTPEVIFDAADRPAKATLLGPLDNLMWDRALIQKLFGFHYAWEVYVPPEKRVYGSYTIPVLYGDRFIGRIQLAQKNGALLIENWWPEENLKATKAMRRELHAAVTAHAAMLGAKAPQTVEL